MRPYLEMGSCKRNEVKMRSYRLRVVSNPTTGVLTREKLGPRPTQREEEDVKMEAEAGITFPQP